eukprot:TRINITY_DN1578_c1_g1_i1.p1 TRINITY_DN1578_c1_g1~~TRINITY_DN1578_c1_g1_i1.p1  ORF type:complete len:393 (+),score=86.24 TRINITY_DN1578_c1_g1_i1:49-1227(+)
MEFINKLFGGNQQPKIIIEDPVTHLTASFFNSKHLPKTTESNVAFSPYSISSSVLMTSSGASGPTLTELHSSLFSCGGDPHKYFKRSTESVANNKVLAIANSVFIENKDVSVGVDFQNLVKENYDGVVQSVPFSSNPSSSCTLINKWVEEKTQGKITQLLTEQEVREDTRLILVNAVYFKAKWFTQFDIKDTCNRPFHLIDNKKEVSVPTMKKTGYFGVKEGEKETIIELPYYGNHFSMIIVLPKNNSQAAWDQVTSREYIASLDKLGNISSEEKVVLYLPKFKITWKSELKEYMKEMGVATAFTPQADFSKMTNEKERLYISAVIHQTVVAVGEEGTEASAATSVVISRSMGIEPPKEIHVNHPFMFFIRHYNPTSDHYTTIFAGYLKTFY